MRFFFYLTKDLKKGLIKVMDKQYEPLIQALLTDKNSVDVDRICESLYVIDFNLLKIKFKCQQKVYYMKY